VRTTFSSHMRVAVEMSAVWNSTPCGFPPAQDCSHPAFNWCSALMQSACCSSPGSLVIATSIRPAPLTLCAALSPRFPPLRLSDVVAPTAALLRTWRRARLDRTS